MEVKELPDYASHLSQSSHWPREEGDVPIHEMNAGHAINAYHLLRRWAMDGHWPGNNASRVIHTPLAMALLQQAVGVTVVYSDDLPPAPPVDDAELDDNAYSVHLDLEKCFDALEAISDHTHPVTRARELLRSLVFTP